MKYLKTFEIINYGKEWIPKFKIGDYVKIQGENHKLGDWQSEPYEIIKIGHQQDYLLDTVIGGYIWRNEKNLFFVPEYEIIAKKYNIG